MMRCLKVLLVGWALVFSATVSAFDFDSSYYAVYEGVIDASGCRPVYIVPHFSLLILSADVPAPIRFMPQTTGFKTTLCSDGSFGAFQKVALTADDMIALGATLSDYKLFGGDFDGDGEVDFFLQGRDSAQHSLVLTADMTGTPKVLYNYHGTLSSNQYPQINLIDVDHDGRADIIATDASGSATTFFGSAYIEPPTITPSVTPTLNITLAGSIDGKFRVDESGAATYNVDIFAAPGTAGTQPHISLNYSSNSGDGVAGLGWSIGGLSVIERCRQTQEQDGNVAPIAFTTDDRFCLDGQRLILTGGTYGGSPSSTYRTEVDSYATITAYGTVGGNPKYFIVRRKDGSISYYGDAAASGSNNSAPAVNLNGAVTHWAISRYQDAVGNAIRFQYLDNGVSADHRISRIDYAYGTDMGNTNNSTTYIRFDYEARPDASAGYSAGVRFRRTQRLTAIRSFSNNVELRNYNLVYRAPDAIHKRSFVEKLYECVGTDCLSPTTFNWQLNQGGFSAGVQVATAAGAKLTTIRPMDINGDGRTDIVYRSMMAPNYPLLYRMADGNGGFGPEQTLLATTPYIGNLPDLMVSVLDINNDSRQDLLYVDPGTSTFPATLFNGGSSGFAAGVSYGDLTMSLPVAADVNGDGLPDLHGTSFPLSYYRSAQRTNIGGTWTTTFAAKQPFFSTANGGALKPSGCTNPGAWSLPSGLLSTGADFNGDGRVDFTALLDFRNGSTACNVTYVGAAISAGAGNFSFTGITLGSPVPPLDMNGDGLADLWYDDAGSRKLRFSTGTDFTAPITVGNSALMSAVVYVDYDGDGFQDVLYPSAFGVMGYQLFDPVTQTFGGGNGTTMPYQSASGNIAADQYVQIDIDGDGHPDLLRIASNGTSSTMTLFKSADAGGAGNRIVGIDNGFGAATNVTYKPLTDSNTYTRANDANQVNTWPSIQPVVDVTAPIYVVSRVTSTSPAANATTPGLVDNTAARRVDYQYSGLKLQSSGRGSLGFASIKSTDYQTGIATETFYRQDFPYTGMPSWTLQVTQGGVVMKSITQSYDSVKVAALNGTSYYRAYPLQTTEVTKDPVVNTEVGYVVTDKAPVDIWGNTPSVTTSSYPASSHAAYLTQKVVTNTYSSTGDQRYGRLTSSSVSHRRSGSADITRGTSYTYYPSGTTHEGQLWTEQVFAGSAPTKTTTYEYDVFGNRSKITHSVAGEDSRYVVMDYDSTGRFVATSKSLFNDGSGGWSEQVMDSVVSRNDYGQPTEVHGLNGLITYYDYDPLGREASRRDNTGAGVNKVYINGGLAGAHLQVKATASTGAVTAEYFDALGRSMARGQVGFDGRWIYSETEYDSIGRVKRQSNSHYSGDTAYWTTNTYDAFRLLNRVVPASGGVNATTKFGYNGLTTTITNALGQLRTEVRNAAGELVSVTDHLNGVVSYTYNAVGDLLQTTNSGRQNGGSVTISTVLTYDDLGRKIKILDSDKGTWFYKYNGFGEVTDQYKVMSTWNYSGTLDAALAALVPMQRTQMVYDRRGRTIQRSEYREGGVLESSTKWEYDTAQNGLGLVATDYIEDQTIGHVYGYDQYGRISEKLDYNDIAYYEETSYDAYGRVATQTDAVGTGSGTRSTYNAYGYLDSIKDLATNAVLYQVQNMDALGNVSTAVIGNGSTSTWYRDQGSGLLLNQTSIAGSTTLQNFTYTWDALGNQTSRRDQGLLAPTGVKDLKQSFCYDGLNRLVTTNQATLNGSCSLTPATQDLEYDSFGGITRKAGIGTYTYNNGRPHQLASTSDGVSYTYDAVGNMLSDTSGRTLSYSVFDKPLSVTKGTDQIVFGYGVDHELLKRVDTRNSVTSTTNMIGNVEKVVKADGSYDMKRSLAGVALWTHHFNSSGVETSVDKQYVYRDVLGSVVMVTNELAVSKQQFAYDPWGRRAWVNNWSLNVPGSSFLPVSSQLTTEGYTGHEMLDAVDLIHMQGRVYDQRLGRFIQADQTVQAPEFLQSYNRYAYVVNAPLQFTDPTGYNGAGDDTNTLYNSLGYQLSGGVDATSFGGVESVTVTSTPLPIDSFGSYSFGSADFGSPASFSGASFNFDFGSTPQAIPMGTSIYSANGGQENGGNSKDQKAGADRHSMSGVASQGGGESTESQKAAEEVIVTARKMVNDTQLRPGTGYVSYSDSEGQWGKERTIHALEALGERWNKQQPNAPRIQIGDISKDDGTDFKPHKTHKNGLDVDIRPMREQGLGPTNYKDGKYSRALTQDLVNAIRADPSVKNVIFNDPDISGTQKGVAGHDNHIHVTYR